MAGFLSELKRRNVVKVGIAYAVVAWVLIEIASVILPGFGAPDWTFQVFTSLVILGFPLALIFAWAFELTPEGLKREREVDRSNSITTQTGRKLDFAIIALLIIALSVSITLHFTGEPGTDSATSESSVGLNSIAVLPFQNMSSDQENEYFSDGLSETLLHMLAQISDLRVAARTSSFQFKGQTGDIASIGQQLKVATVLEGSVRKSGDTVRVTAQLIKVADGYHLWSGTYDRQLMDIFAIQDEIASKVVEALKVTLLGEERERLVSARTDNPESYDAYLLGQQRLQAHSVRELEEAEEYFTRAIELDPEFAPAYAGLGKALVDQNLFGMISHDEMWDGAHAALDRALFLDDQLAVAYAVKGMLYSLDGNLEAADTAFEKALKLSPNDAEVLNQYAMHSRYAGEWQRAIEYFDRALDLDPLSTELLSRAAFNYGNSGYPEKALQVFEKLRAVNDRDAVAFQGPAVLHMTAGEIPEAIPLMLKAMEFDPDDHEIPALIGFGYLMVADYETAQKWFAKAESMKPDNYLVLGQLATLNLYTGNSDEAVRLAKKIYEPGLDVRWGTNEIVLRILRDDYVERGELVRARQLYEQEIDGILEEDHELQSFNCRLVIDYAYVMIKVGLANRANAMLDFCAEALSDLDLNWYAKSYQGIDTSEVEILALRGDKAGALALLREAVDAGWRIRWQRRLTTNHNLDSIRDEPEFKAVVAQIEGEMAAQRQQLAALEQ